MRGCDELVLDKKENEKLKQNDEIFHMETRFIEEIIKDKNNKNIRGKFGEFCKTTCHPHILRFSIYYRWFCDGEGCSKTSGLKETLKYKCEY